MRAHRSLTISAFAAELAPVLGNEQALAMVQAAVEHLRHRSEILPVDRQRDVLIWLGDQRGVIGAAARHLLRQFDARSAQARPSIPSPPQATPPDETGSLVARKELAAAFERAVGSEKAREIVDKACRARLVEGDPIRAEAAGTILEDLARVPGIVGVVARFAKARFVLIAAEGG